MSIGQSVSWSVSQLVGQLVGRSVSRSDLVSVVNFDTSAGSEVFSAVSETLPGCPFPGSERKVFLRLSQLLSAVFKLAPRPVQLAPSPITTKLI